jgi:uncharacterized protein YjbI with pentapeptide repeats
MSSENRQNSRYNTQGRKFYQNSLPSDLDLQNVKAGSKTLFKILLTILAVLLSIISGCLAALAGGTIAVNIVVPYNFSGLPFLCTLLVIFIGTAATLKQGISRGLFVTTLVTFVVLILMSFIAVAGTLAKIESLNLELVIFTCLAIIILLPLSIISFLCSSYALSVFYYLLPYRYSRQIKLAFCFLFILSATLLTDLALCSGKLTNNSFQGIPIHSELGVRLRGSIVFCGFLFSMGIAISSLLAVRLSQHPDSQFQFLRHWAIALCSWGGTSFYNLNLSGVNFRGAKLANTDLRARKLYRTCFKGVAGLDRARVDNRYLDLDNRKVQRLLTDGCSEDKDFSRINLQGAYLQKADMQEFQLVESNLTGADLEDAKLQNSILVRARATGVDFTDADLTGICIEDWSVNSQTIFARVKCNYIYRKYENGEPTDRYPADRYFEPGEFEALHQEVDNVVELVFKDGVNWRAFGFTLEKIEIEDDGLGLKVKGVEKRGELFVVKVAHKEGVPRQDVEERIYQNYDEILKLVMLNSQQLNQLTGITTNLATALNEVSKRLGNSNFFLIVGSDITNLTGSGRINYEEASNTIRSIVANGCEPAQIAPLAQNLLEQFQSQKVATDVAQQAELIEQVILDQANKDPFFKQFFVQQSQQIADAIPESTIASAIRNAIAQLT